MREPVWRWLVLSELASKEITSLDLVWWEIESLETGLLEQALRELVWREFGV
jgi:hypothetical protein